MAVLLGFIGVLGFSGSLPATRVAVEGLDPTFVGVGRAVVAGLVAVLVFAGAQGAGLPSAADGLVLVAVAFAALGYAKGGALSRELGGWQTICWAPGMVGASLVVLACVVATQRTQVNAPPPRPSVASLQ